MRRILVLRGGALGDFIVTLPALAALRREWPDARIELAGNPVAAALARNRGLVDAVHSQHEGRWAALYAETPLAADFGRWIAEFDLIVSYWPDPDGTLGRKLPARSGQRFVSAAAMPTHAPAARHYGDALEPLGIRCDSERFQLAPRLSAAADGAIAIHPGSGSARKNWPAERWLETIARLHAPILLVVGEAEASPWLEWSRQQFRGTVLESRAAGVPVEVAASLPLEDLVARFQRSRLFLGHDSGIAHLAAATDTPCILLFGPTNPEMWAPPGEQVTVVRRGESVASISVDDMAAAIARMHAAPQPARR